MDDIRTRDLPVEAARTLSPDRFLAGAVLRDPEFAASTAPL